MEGNLVLLNTHKLGKDIYHSQLLKRIILKFNSSSIALLTMYTSQCCHNRVLYWVYMDPYCFIYWAIREIQPQPPDQYGESTLSILTYQEGQYWEYNFQKLIMSALLLKSGYTVKYSLSPREIHRAPPSGFPSCSGYISPYIPHLVMIQIQYQRHRYGGKFQ